MRIFIAIDLSGALRKNLRKSIENLKAASGLEHIRWVDPTAVHLTLKFIGETPTMQVEEIEHAIARIAERTKRFDLRVSGLGCFPSCDRPRVLWIGLSEPTGELQKLHRRLEDGLHKAGIQREKREYHPHLTIGRVRKQTPMSLVKTLGQEIKSRDSIELGIEPVDELSLIESELRPSGAVYTVLSSHALGTSER